jgi:hypothetical protein
VAAGRGRQRHRDEQDRGPLQGGHNARLNDHRHEAPRHTHAPHPADSPERRRKIPTWLPPRPPRRNCWRSGGAPLGHARSAERRSSRSARGRWRDWNWAVGICQMRLSGLQCLCGRLIFRRCPGYNRAHRNRSR